MREQTLSGRQLACITALFIVGNSSAVGSSGVAGRDSWIAMLLAICAAVLPLLLYARVSALYPGKTLFGSMDAAFGTQVGRLLALPVTLYVFRLGALVLRDFPAFAHNTVLPKTPPAVLTLILALVCAYLASRGPGGFGRVSVLFAVTVGAVAVLTFLLLIPNMSLHYLRPVLTTPPEHIALGAGKLLSAPFGETVVLLCLYSSAKQGERKTRAYLTGLLMGGAYLLAAVLRNILALGAGNFDSVYYPSYSAVSLINIGDFFQRIEVLVAGYLLICDVVKIAAALYAAALGVQHIFRLSSHRSAIVPTALAMVPVSLLAYPSNMAFYNWSPVELYIAAPVQLLLPLLLWAVGETIRRRAKRNVRAA